MHLERHWLSQVVRQNLVAHSNTMPRASDKEEKASSKESWVEKPGGSQRRICFPPPASDQRSSETAAPLWLREQQSQLQVGEVRKWGPVGGA